MSGERVKRVSELGIGDEVETPSGKRAVVVGFVRQAAHEPRVDLDYLNAGGGVTLAHHQLRLVKKAAPRVSRASAIAAAGLGGLGR